MKQGLSPTDGMASRPTTLSLHRLPARRLPTVDTRPAAGGFIQGVRIPRALWLAAAVTHCLGCAGAVYGFSSIAVILGRDGVFQSLCSAGAAMTNGVCDAQALAIDNLYAGASVASFAAPAVLGIVLDRRGPRTAMLLAVAIFTLGPILALVASKTRIDALYYPAFVAFGLGASSSLIPCYNIANLFAGNEALALGVMNGAFDAGTLTFGIMLRLSNSGIGWTTILIAYLACPVALSWIFVLFLWRDSPFPRALPALAADDDVADADATPAAGSPTVTMAPVSGATTPDHADASPAVVRDVVVIAAPPGSASPKVNYRQVGGNVRVTVAEVGTDGVYGMTVQPAMSPGKAIGDARRRGPLRRTASSGSFIGGSAIPAGYAEVGVVADVPPLEDEDDKEDDEAKAGGATAYAAVHASPLEGSTSNAVKADPMSASSGGTPVASAMSGGDEVAAQPRPADVVMDDDVASRLPPFDLPRLQALPLLGQLASMPFLTFAAFFAANVLRLTFFLGTAGEQFASLGDNDASVTALLGIILPLGFFTQFAVGPLIDRRGIVVAAAVLWVLSVAFSAVNLVPSLTAQLPAMILFAAFRGFLFTTMANFLSATFGFRYVGTLIGIVTLLGGLAGLLLSPLLVWALGQPEGFTPPNALLLGLVVAAGAFPLAMYALGARRRALKS